MTTVLGTKMTQFWAPDLDNEQNRRFVAEFRQKYDKYPSFYAAQAYDSIFYIKAAVEAVDGDLENLDGIRAALAKADFPSVRGDFEMGPNHYPIQNFYERTVVEDAEGNCPTEVGQTVLVMNQARYDTE